MTDYDTAVYNFPAIITDGGLLSQLRKPILDWPVRVQKAEGAPEPRGVVQEFASRVRIGAMAFNRRGSETECTMVDGRTNVLYACGDGDNRDGAQVIWPIGSEVETVGHTAGLVAEINATKADTWTPLAEMMFTAVGYYTQRSEFELNTGHDWSQWDPPITEYCQNNNVLIITDGASTADQRGEVLRDLDGDGKDKKCGDLYGSTYFDDWAYYGRQGENLYIASPYDFFTQPEPINTFVVYTASDRSSPDDQCSSYGLLKAAVDKGGPNATNPGMSDVVFEGDDPEKLKAALRDAFKAILKRASAGSAASVISATRSGEGAVYQAIFWPGIDGPDGKPDVTWAGEVHSLLVDAYGRIYEDTDGDMALTDADERVIFFFDEHGSPAETKACYGTIEEGVCSGEVKSIHDVKYLWSAAEWLADISEADILTNRSNYISNQKKRYIFTWNDLNNDGIVDANEILPFDTSTNWSALSVKADRRDVPHDFGVGTADEVDQIVAWIRGKDSTGLRSRQVVKPSNFNVTAAADNTITWRLGDIIHSTPTVVGRPAESYHLLYQDSSYTGFAAKYKDRRQVVYFGGNDGKIHAVNGGFYNEDAKKYCLTPDCANNGSAPALGAELWAYVPYNLQPQLKCLLDPVYLHRYYVDQKPRIFDVQIFEDSIDHPGGWGTILVAGMRLGGNTVSAEPVDGIDDSRRFTSSYVIFDVTNPEKAPVLLGELTYDPDNSIHMGYTTAVPTVVPMKKGPDTMWYLVLGSGPIWHDESGNWISDMAIEGRSNQPGKIAIFPLNDLTQAFPGPFRIPKNQTNGKAHWILDDDNSFISDLITVDFDLDKDYRGDTVYFGTVQGDWGDWAGKMYRFTTEADNNMSTPEQWKRPKVLFDPGRPITAAASIGWDGYNHWVYFGTGRFFDKKDKSDSSSNDMNYYFGIKEPKDCGQDPPAFAWETVSGFDKLMRTDQIQVQASYHPSASAVSCKEGSNCLPPDVKTLDQLIQYTAGKGCEDTDPSGKAGWYQQLPLGERNLGQATLLGGLLTYTTYQPFDDVCRPDGLSYLSAVYYQTGTAWHHAVFDSPYGLSSDDPTTVLSRFELGHGLATTPNLHVGRHHL
jgi:type IV pilus assembly protein PilY1